VSLRARLVIGLALVALAGWAALVERRSSHALASHAQDSARLDALLAARSSLDTSVLEARAALQLTFDPINQAISALRSAASDAALLRGRGSAYAPVAVELERVGQALQLEEASIERFKTDLALLRLSSRHFPVIADALARQDERTQLSDAVAELRTGLELYEESPTQELARRAHAALRALERVALEDAERERVNVLLGHARVIVDRRERVDGFARMLAGSSVRGHVAACESWYVSSRWRRSCCWQRRRGPGASAAASRRRTSRVAELCSFPPTTAAREFHGRASRARAARRAAIRSRT
jgi:hypothetical protein